MRTLKDQLIEKGLSRPRAGEIDQKSIRTRDRQEERLTDRELADLMGVNRDVYRRGPGGAFRRR
ncbi:hypothetical protein ACFQ38_16280 [Sporosarcina contaminans]|uniref:Uncharacterized protein n=1 Tax=Sporosarcina contaminans TaxID=633403 RepID=A0ABW3U105_9BACL